MKKHFKRVLLLCIALGLVAAVVLDFAAYLGATRLKVTSYQVEAEVTQSLRIVHLTDLHSREYGQGNEKLVALVKAQQPDLIFITGDMLTVSDEGPEVVCRLIPKLLEIAPVYYGYGNHEKEWEEENGKLLEPELTKAGAIVLDCAYIDIELKGQQLRIGGYHGYWRQPHMTSDDWVKIHTELDFCAAFEETDRVKLLLCHIPTAWLDWNYIDKWPGGIVFSGHYHGGQVRLPFVGGLYVPYVGWLPEYTKGVFEGEKATCVLSVGAGSPASIPRIFNLPEIVVVDIRPEK